jgi:hypothetical protein
MARFFTHYWTNATLSYTFQRNGNATQLLGHTASNEFRKRGIASGDFLYVVSMVKGCVHLVGRIEVDAILSLQEAQVRLETNNLWEAEDHAIAKPGTSRAASPDLEVPFEIAQTLRFKTSNKREPERGLVFSGPGKRAVDKQTLRTVRELTARSAVTLDELLGHIENAHVTAAHVLESAFNPAGIEDSRNWTKVSIALRQGQPRFRNELLQIYGRRCAITDCDAEQALEAAHIFPYQGADSNAVANGLLLRADIHTLFDNGLLAIDTTTMTVIVSPQLSSTVYIGLHGCSVKVPLSPTLQPNKDALDHHRARHKL